MYSSSALAAALGGGLVVGAAAVHFLRPSAPRVCNCNCYFRFSDNTEPGPGDDRQPAAARPQQRPPRAVGAPAPHLKPPLPSPRARPPAPLQPAPLHAGSAAEGDDCGALRRVRIYHGFNLAVDPSARSYTEATLLETGQWEPELVALMEAAVRRLEASGEDLSALRWYDVGCNVGFYSLWAARRGFGEVHCFEPMRENLRKIRCALSFNPALAPRVRVHPYAAGDRAQSCVIYAPERNPNDGKLYCNNPRAERQHAEGQLGTLAERVEVRRMDALVSRPPDVLKMDVEGAEPSAVAGMGALLPSSPAAPWTPARRDAPAFVFTEFAPGMVINQRADPAKFLADWDRRGYTVINTTNALCAPCSRDDFPRILQSGKIDNLILARAPFAPPLVPSADP